jgi:hypothetical protein
VCGQNLKHLASGRPERLQSQAVARCPNCLTDFLITTKVSRSDGRDMQAMSTSPVPQCGAEEFTWDRSAPFVPLIDMIMKESA